jgi:hypothetical protein
MRSLGATIKFGLERKKMPAFTPGDARDLAVQLGLSFPVSVKDLIDAIDKLPPDSVTLVSGPLTANYVHGSVQLFLQSDGGMAFTGQAHEAGVVGDNFLLAIALLDVKDASAKTLVFAHTDTVAGQYEVGFSDKNWQDFGFNQLVQDTWPAAKNTRFQAVLKAQTDPWQVTEAVLVGIFVAIGGVLVGRAIPDACKDGANWKCGWVPVGNPNAPLIPGDQSNPPGVGFEYRCRCEW